MKRNAETGRARVAAPNLRVAPAAKLPYNDEVTTFKHRSSLPLGQVRIKGGAGGGYSPGPHLFTGFAFEVFYGYNDKLARLS